MTDCPRCPRLEDALRAQQVDLENAEVDLRVARRKVKKLQADIAKLEAEDPLAEEVKDVFDYWVATCKNGNPRVVLGDKRRKAILGRLREGKTVEELKRACDGAAADAYVNPKGVRFDDIELICRDEVNVDKFIARAEAARRRTNVVPIRPGLPTTPALRPLDRVLDALSAMGYRWLADPRSLHQWIIECPACDSLAPYTTVMETDDGVWFVCPVPSCTPEKIVARLGLDPGILNPLRDRRTA